MAKSPRELGNTWIETREFGPGRKVVLRGEGRKHGVKVDVTLTQAGRSVVLVLGHAQLAELSVMFATFAGRVSATVTDGGE